jgi:hypothetical protein
MDRKKAKFVAILGLLTFAILLVMGLQSREDILWWWRMRGVVQVHVMDIFLKDYVLADPASVAGARKITKSFIDSLQGKERGGVENADYLSDVLLRSAEDREGIVFSVKLHDMIDAEYVEIDCMGTRYICPISAWLGYLRDLLRPITHHLLAVWRNQSNPDERLFRTAFALALLAPRTEGLVEFLRRFIEEKQYPYAILFLGEMGPVAGSEASLLESLIVDPGTKEELRAFARQALKKIKG